MSLEQLLKSPTFKGKGFNPMPIARGGIPKEADSRRDKRVIGTPMWQAFWEEQLHYIHHGIQTGGLYLPGRFYWYMNYKVMSTIKGVTTPDYVDLHLDFANAVEFVKSNGKNLIVPKGRRKGVSEEAHTIIPDYGWRFFPGYKGGIASGKKDYVDDFLAKWKFGDSKLPPELRLKKLKSNDDEIIAGFKIKDESGDYVEKGTMNTLYARTAHTNPGIFKGLYLNDIICEEVGEFEKFLEFFSASKDCLKSGNKQVGSMICFGTGGNIEKGSKDFKKVWEHASDFNFEKFLIPATRFYYYGGAKEPERRLPDDSELYLTHKPYELIGVEDTARAEADIKANREKLLKARDLKAYNEDLQNNPLNEKEIFKKTVVNNFPIDKLNEQDFRISALTHPKFSRYRMEWIKDDKGMIKSPLQVKAVPLKDHEDSDEIVYIIDGEHPRRGFSNLYCSGIDGYDIDTSKTSKSLGAMCVLIRENSIGSGTLSKVPVAVIRTRPKRKEMFYQLCLQLSVYYNMVGNVLGDVASGVIINYFKENGGAKFLAVRPKAFESEGSEQAHDFWVRLTGFSKGRMVALMQTHIEDHIQDIWFNSPNDKGPALLNELGNYDEFEINSDNDLADAYGIALMQDVSMDIRPRDNSAEDNDKTYDLPDYVMGGSADDADYDAENPEFDGGGLGRR